MTKPEKLLRGDQDIVRGLIFGDEERPLGAQICGRDPEPAVAAALDLRRRGYDLIDLNMGCPLKKECARGRGAALLREPDVARRLIESLVLLLQLVRNLQRARTGGDRAQVHVVPASWVLAKT